MAKQRTAKPKEFVYRLTYRGQHFQDTKTYAGPTTPRRNIGDAIFDLQERVRRVKGAKVDEETLRTALESLNNRPDPTLHEPLHIEFFLEDVGIWFGATITKEKIQPK